jgi:hypothetical protein
MVLNHGCGRGCCDVHFALYLKQGDIILTFIIILSDTTVLLHYLTTLVESQFPP